MMNADMREIAAQITALSHIIEAIYRDVEALKTAAVVEVSEGRVAKVAEARKVTSDIHDKLFQRRTVLAKEREEISARAAELVGAFYDKKSGET